MTETVEVDVDSRNRISLGKLASAKRYLATVDEDGSIHLTPAATISLRELEVLKNPELVERIQEGIRQAGAGNTVNMTERIQKLAAEADAGGIDPFK